MHEQDDTKFRQCSKHTLRKVASTTQDAVDAVHGVESAAFLTRGSKSMMSVYTNANEPQYIGVDQAIDLMIAGKNIVFLELLAQEFGYTLVKNMRADPNTQWGKEFMAVAKTTGDALNKIAIALEDDDDITSDEIKALKLRKVVAKTMQTLVNVDNHLKKVEEDAEG